MPTAWACVSSARSCWVTAPRFTEHPSRVNSAAFSFPASRAGMAVDRHFKNCRVLITGGLGFIGSNLARRLVELEAEVLLVDSLVPEHGGRLFNVADIRDRVTVELADARDEERMGQHVRLAADQHHRPPHARQGRPPDLPRALDPSSRPGDTL